MKESGESSANYSGFLNTYDLDNKYDYDLSLSVGKASYSMVIEKETRTKGILWWKTEQTRYTATFTVTDTYNFDELRDWDSFGGTMNNIGLCLQAMDVIKPYDWEATFIISTKWE